MSDYEHLLYEQDGPIVRLTLNRPEKLNALNDPLMYSLDRALDRIQADQSVRVAILSGAGRAFCSGYDLSAREQPLVTVQDWRDHATRAGRDVVMKLWDLRVPVIAAVHGYALGGGCDLLLASDITLLADNAKIGLPEVRGVSSPPTFILPWVVGIKKAKELMLLGDSIDAQEALRLGIGNKVVPVDDLQAEAMHWAKRLARIPPVAIDLNKKAINHAYEVMGIKSAIAYGVEIFTLLMTTPEAAAFNKTVEEKGLKAALAERDQALP